MISEQLLILSKYTLRSLMTLVYIFVCNCTYAQTNPINQLQIAKRDFAENNTPIAISNIKKASSIFSESQDWDSIYACQIVFFQNSKAFTDLNILYTHLVSLDSLIPVDRTVQAHGKSQYLMAYVQSQIGNVDKTIEHYSLALDVFSTTNDTVRYSGALGNLAHEYTQLGNYSKAIAYKLKSVELAKSVPKNRVNYIGHLRGLAEIYYYKGDFKNAKKCLFEVAKLIGGMDSDIYLSLSMIEYDQGNNIEAMRLISEAENQYNGDELSIAYIQKQLADIHTVMGNLPKAISIYKSIEDVILKQSNKRLKAKYLYAFGKLYAQSYEFKTSLEYYNESLISFCDVDLEGLTNLSDKGYIFKEIWLGDLFYSIGQLYYEEYKKNTNEDDLLNAQKYFDFSLYALDQKRDWLSELESTQNLTEKAKDIYEGILDMYIQLFENNKDTKYLKTAFELSQKYNGFILRQQLREKTVLNIVQATSIEKDAYFFKKFNFHQDLLLLSSTYSDSLFAESGKSEKEFLHYRNSISSKYDKFEELSRIQRSIKVSEIQNTLDNESCIVKYFVGVKSIYIFRITEGDINYHKIKVRKNLTSDLLRYRELLSSYQSHNEDSLRSNFIDLSNSLYQDIAQPFVDSLSDEITKLTIIPSGPLVFVPFESLIFEKEKNWNNPSSYLLSKYNISYAYFCGQLISTRDEKAALSVSTFGLEYDEFTIEFMKKSFNKNVANPNLDKLRHANFSPLYFADDEAIEIASMLDGDYFVNENATKENFFIGGVDSDIIHISAHSFIDSEFPENSCIIFNKPDSLSDNLLKLNDIYNLDLDAQLVTLSACNTLYGKQVPGEGLMSMARAFTNAGASSVVGSLWSVPDEISNILMQLFYQKLKEGKSKSEALREAKIEFLTNDNLCNPSFRTPAYWSSWVIYGNDSPIIKPNHSNFSKAWQLLIAFLVLLLLFRLLPKAKAHSKEL